MSSSIGTSTSSPTPSTIRDDVLRMASKRPSRPDVKQRKGVITESDVKADVKAGLKSVGINVDNAARKVDTNGDTKVTTSELAAVQASQNATLAAKLDSNGDGKVTKAEVTGNADKLARSRDTNGDGKVSKQENVDAAKKLAAQFDAEYGSMRLKGFSREDVKRELGPIVSNGSRAGVLAGNTAYEVSKADSNGDGMISTSEAGDYVDSKTGISEKVKEYEKHKEAEKTDKAEETKKTDKAKEAKKADEAKETRKADEAKEAKKADETKEAEKSDAQRAKLSQTYVNSDNVSGSTLSVSA